VNHTPRCWKKVSLTTRDRDAWVTLLFTRRGRPKKKNRFTHGSYKVRALRERNSIVSRKTAWKGGLGRGHQRAGAVSRSSLFPKGGGGEGRTFGGLRGKRERWLFCEKSRSRCRIDLTKRRRGKIHEVVIKKANAKESTHEQKLGGRKRKREMWKERGRRQEVAHMGTRAYQR